jgi:integrase/recombinase XerD
VAEASSARNHALLCLLALNGLRISEALGADVGDLGEQREHRTLELRRKGGKRQTAPLAPHERSSGRLASRAGRLDR